jgi:hypothetical protein
MWRAVLAVRGVPGPHDAGDAVEIVDVTAPHALAVTLEDATSPVLVVGHAADTTAVRTACGLFAAHRPDTPVAAAFTAHTTGAALAALRLARAATDDAGHARRVWHEALKRGWSAVVLDSVARLERPNPTLAQHVRSWLPGSRFAVRQGPHPRAVDARAASLLVEDIPRGEHDLLVDVGAAEDPVTRAVVAAVAPRRLLPLGIPATDTARLYGRRERFELSLVPDPGTWPVPRPGPACRTCGLATTGQACAFCRTVEVPAPAPSPVAPRVPAGAAS